MELDQRFKPSNDIILPQSADLLILLFAIFKKDQRRDATDSKLRGGRRTLVDIHFGNDKLSRALCRNLLDNGS